MYGTLVQMRRRRHDAVDVSSFSAAVGADQAYRAVALDFVLGWLAQAVGGNAAASARSRSASKRTGRR